ncbi:hypothetical protein [Vibrio vulnificus]|uniref:hypothetical protein n=1 Tax=Vibrio vulnificus TaxID=672 RepID=UPI003EDAC76C
MATVNESTFTIVDSTIDQLTQEMKLKNENIAELRDKNDDLLKQINARNKEFHDLQEENRNKSEELNNMYQSYDAIHRESVQNFQQAEDLKQKCEELTATIDLQSKEINSLSDIDKIKRKELIYSRFGLSIPLILLIVLGLFSYLNPGIYKVQEETVYLISQGMNAALLLIIPFICGTLAALTRVLISELPVMKNTFLIIASGLMSVFSWVGVKSGVIATLIEQNQKAPKVSMPLTIDSPEAFYKMILIAVIVGMFSSSIFVYVQEKVDRLTKRQPDASTSNT